MKSKTRDQAIKEALKTASTCLSAEDTKPTDMQDALETIHAILKEAHKLLQRGQCPFFTKGGYCDFGVPSPCHTEKKGWVEKYCPIGNEQEDD